MDDVQVMDDLLLEAAVDMGKLPRVSILAYSGGIMKVPGWGNIVIDLSNLDASGGVAILSDHDSTRRGVVGHGSAQVRDNRLIVTGLVDGTTYTLTATDIVDRAEAANAGRSQAEFVFHARKPGLVWALFTADNREALTEPAKLTPQKTGVTKTIDLGVVDAGSDYGLLFTGRIVVPTDGTYTFSTTSDDGSVLWIDGEAVVNNAGWHGMEEKSGKVDLKAGPHDINVYFYQGDGGQGLEVTWSGPDFERASIPEGALFHIPAAEAS